MFIHNYLKHTSFHKCECSLAMMVYYSLKEVFMIKGNHVNMSGSAAVRHRSCTIATYLIKYA